MKKALKPVVLIIGGTSGIGLETARTFGKDHEVVIVGRDIKKISNDASVKDAVKLSFDIRKQKEELLERIEGLHISKIVLSAGIFKSDDESDPEYEQEYKDVKLGGYELVKGFMATRPKELTHVSAVSSLYTFLPNSFVPVPEKRVNEELEKKICSLKGVIANCVAPGLTRTPLTEKAYGEEGMQKILDAAPGSRVVKPREVAEKIYQLSNQREITGEVFPVDGEFLKFFIHNKKEAT